MFCLIIISLVYPMQYSRRFISLDTIFIGEYVAILLVISYFLLSRLVHFCLLKARIFRVKFVRMIYNKLNILTPELRYNPLCWKINERRETNVPFNFSNSLRKLPYFFLWVVAGYSYAHFFKMLG